MSQTSACPEVPDAKEAAARVVEIRRLLGIFARGCPNSEIVNGEPEACEECTTQIFGFIQNVVEGRAYDADRASRALPSTALAARPEEDTARINWLAAHKNAELSMQGGLDDDDARWSVHFVNGGRSDREWTEMGQGQTVREAIDAAMLAATSKAVRTEYIPPIKGAILSSDEIGISAPTPKPSRRMPLPPAPSTPPTAGDGHD